MQLLPIGHGGLHIGGRSRCWHVQHHPGLHSVPAWRCNPPPAAVSSAVQCWPACCPPLWSPVAQTRQPPGAHQQRSNMHHTASTLKALPQHVLPPTHPPVKCVLRMETPVCACEQVQGLATVQLVTHAAASCGCVCAHLACVLCDQCDVCLLLLEPVHLRPQGSGTPICKGRRR
jgi:hypothetical protein